MNCESVRKWFSEYVMVEIRNPWVRMVNEHIANCQRCSEEIGEIRQTLETMTRAKQVEVPQTMYFKLAQELEGTRTQRRILRFLKEPIPLYGVVAVLAGLCIIFTLPRAIRTEAPLQRTSYRLSYLRSDTSLSFVPSATVRTNLAGVH